MQQDSKRKILIFLVNTFIFSFIIDFFLMAKDGLANPNAESFLQLAMMMPAFCVIITQFVTHEKFRSPYLKLNFSHNVGNYTLCYFLIQFLIVFGTIIYFCIFPHKFDNGLHSMAEALRLEYGQDVDTSGIYSLMLIQIVFSVISGPFFNIVFSFGEEYGWHGYLFPKLCNIVSPLTASVICGAVRGIWYAPFIYMGYCYGIDNRLAGIVAMIISCIFIGFIKSYYTYKTKSVFPAVLMSSAYSVLAQTGVLFSSEASPNPFIGPSPSGIIGGIGIIIFGVYCAVLLRKDNSK
ncbi:MAG: CPBP family intramembrane metalloprotease [Ruminococcaceae bacterium]|nr:CPBP family intramembrane metalloprotease [Oscillospiraceae bacterium]